MVKRSEKPSAADTDGHMSVHKHLLELRGHLFLIALVFIVFSTVGYAYQKEVLAILLAPLNGQELSYLTLAGGFSFIFKITMWCGAAAAIPVVLFALYKFVSPALPAPARSRSIYILPLSVVLMVSGGLFGYFYAIPGAIRFLLEFADQYVNAMLTADSYLNFVLAYTVGLGILFQIPLLMMLINWARPLKPLKLLAFERWVVLVAFIAAAFITPTPDVVNQCVIALPIIAMYQVGFLAVVLVNWQKHETGKRGRLHLAPTRRQREATATTQVSSTPVELLVTAPVRRPIPPKSAYHSSMDGLMNAKHEPRTMASITARTLVRNAAELSIPTGSDRARPHRAIDGVTRM